MSKEDSIEVQGTVVEKFPSGKFSVQLEHERLVLAHLAGRLRRNRIRVLAGDKVTLELSPYDLTKGRIPFRHREGWDSTRDFSRGFPGAHMVNALFVFGTRPEAIKMA